MLFCGIDLHSNNSVVVISDENDKVLYYQMFGSKPPALAGEVDSPGFDSCAVSRVRV